MQFKLIFEEPTVVALPARHAAASSATFDLRRLRGDAFVMTLRTVVSACHKAGFEPVLGQSAPQVGSVVTASMAQVQVNGVVYWPIERKAPVTLAYRRGRNVGHRAQFHCAFGRRKKH